MKKDDIEYSEEVQYVLGKIPHWIIRWGITVMFCLFVGVFIGSYLIKYPQTITGTIIITTINPPVDLIARTSGRIDKIFIEESGEVEKDSVVALLYSAADYDAICMIYDSINKPDVEFQCLINSEWFDKTYLLGELQGTFLEFRRLCLDLKHYLNTQQIETKKNLIAEQIQKNREYYKRQLTQRSNLEKDIRFEQANLHRDSVLFAQNVLSLVEYEQSQRIIIQKENSIENISAALITTELNILQMEHQLVELTTQKSNDFSKYYRDLENLRRQLLNQIEQWKYQYVITSPIHGCVTYPKYWSVNQSVSAGERLASVVPVDSMQIVGRMIVSTNRFGEVKKGQRVNVKLNSYPYMEHGILTGYIRNLTYVRESGGYIVEVEFPGRLMTTYKKEIPLIQEMDGVADIITEDQRLIMRFLKPFKSLLNNN